jgi:hypothetical protein
MPTALDRPWGLVHGVCDAVRDFACLASRRLRIGKPREAPAVWPLMHYVEVVQFCDWDAEATHGAPAAARIVIPHCSHS